MGRTHNNSDQNKHSQLTPFTTPPPPSSPPPLPLWHSILIKNRTKGRFGHKQRIGMPLPDTNTVNIQ